MRPIGLAVLLLLAFTAFADPLGPAVHYDDPNAALVAVASTPAGPLAVWRDVNGTVKANGNVVTTSSARIAAASIGNFALVVWTEADGDVMAARRNADGSAAGVARRVGMHATGPVAIAGMTDRYFVAWPGDFGAIYGAIVNTIGLPMIPAMPITTQSSANVTEIAAAAASAGFAAVWHDVPARKVHAITVNENGSPVSMDPLLLSDDGALPDVASNGEVFLGVWGAGTIESRTFTIDRTLGIVHKVTEGAAPKVAWDGTAFGIAFARTVNPRPGFSFPQLFAMRITIYGTYVEQFAPVSSLLPGDWDMGAIPGRLDLVHSSNGVWVESATVHAPRSRMRAMRH
jgi:hypothetical protein